MDIVHIASELAPIAKVGGLGDVLYGLSKAQVKKGHRVRVFLPKYDILHVDKLSDLKVVIKKEIYTLWSAEMEGIELMLIEDHHSEKYFERGTIYGEEDDVDRFLFFCHSVCQILAEEAPDGIHLHDWPTAACTLLLQGKILFSIHNLEYQGRCKRENLEKFQFPYDESLLSDPLYDDTLNLMKGALNLAHAIVPVSPTYAKEILSSEFGFGLEGVLQQNREKIKGILNGIDTDYWNPETDPFLGYTYSLSKGLSGKRKNKLQLQKQLGFEQNEHRPLVCSITRLVAQKGPDLIEYGIQKVLELGGQFVLLGASEDSEMQMLFERVQEDPNVFICYEYDEPLSHRLYAGSDMLLMPSIFEPCGLSQMIALRYGSIPLVRSTGGLKDTVFEGKNGFCFTTPDNKEVANVLERAFSRFGTPEWDALIQAAMETDLGWEKSAEAYLDLLR